MDGKQNLFSEEILYLEDLLEKITAKKTLFQKVGLLQEETRVKVFLNRHARLKKKLFLMELSDRFLFLSVLAIGQEEVFSRKNEKELKILSEQLREVQQFYQEMGGVIGYQKIVLSLLSQKKKKEKAHYFIPKFIDLRKKNSQLPLSKTILKGIEKLPLLGEMYPVGGAADRLHLRDPDTGRELPAAKLVFLGKILLKWLLDDLQAREYLYYKLFGKNVQTPVALMTSPEKNNHQHLLSLCEEHDWFGRGKRNFRFFVQPLVPTVTQEGSWCMQGPLQRLLLKPGGHGVIWKLAQREKVFDWFKKRNKKKALIRQINNPLAGSDYGLLAFLGYGLAHNMDFGVASCARECHTAEGVNVLVEKEENGEKIYSLSNVEYCDFAQHGIEDIPRKKGENCSRFSSNTNILFVDLKKVEKAIESSPLPGLLINMKPTSFLDEKGEKREKTLGRLESVMQNISDAFWEKGNGDHLLRKSYITYHERGKTISPIKKVFSKNFLETPEKCFFDLMKGYEELLHLCEFKTAPFTTEEKFFKKPPFLFLFHPALGPLFSILSQKIRRGKISEGGELRLEIADLFMEDVKVQGSLVISADHCCGHQNSQKILKYSDNTGKCFLQNVRIVNRGIDWKKGHTEFWKGEWVRQGSCQIVIHGNGEFFAKDLLLKGDQFFEVFAGEKLSLFQKGGSLCQKREKIKKATWRWDYIQKNDQIVLKRKV